MSSLEAAFAAELDALAPGDSGRFEDPVLIACSGGGDSTALLVLAHQLLGPGRVSAGSVNHNLRETAAAEIDAVAALCAKLGIAQQCRQWHWDRNGNLQAAARDARRELLSEMADEVGAEFVLLGHTAEDQAETFLMRLARGSGVDGLGGMHARQGRWLRPMLNFQRAELRSYLQAQDIPWSEDPSNQDPRFDRVRARAMADALGDLGLTQARILKTAALMRNEAEVLRFALKTWADDAVEEASGALLVKADAFAAAPLALSDRFLATTIQWFSGASYKPRREELATWRLRLSSGKPAPLGGVLGQLGDHLVLWREPAAIAGPKPLAANLVSTRWDHRWRLSAPAGGSGAVVLRALGSALSQMDVSQIASPAIGALEASPSIWRDGELVAAPAAGFENGWTATLRPSFTQFLDIH